jgi:hypothetical protein
MAIDWDGVVLGPVVTVFGEPALYSPADGAAYSITGVFDEAYQQIRLEDGQIPITTDLPVFGVRLAQFATPPRQGDQLSIVSNGTAYAIREVRPDGHGWAKLMLNAPGEP